MIDKKLIIAIHARLLSEFGGTDGIRDMGLLESAIARPHHLKQYEPQSSLLDQVSILVCGLIQNHPFVDGNKRVGAVVCELCLFKAGYFLSASEEEKYRVIMRIAAGELNAVDFTVWLQENTTSPHIPHK